MTAGQRGSVASGRAGQLKHPEFWTAINWLRAEAPRMAAALAPAYAALKWAWAGGKVPNEEDLLAALYSLIGSLIEEHKRLPRRADELRASTGGLTVAVWRDWESRAVHAEIAFGLQRMGEQVAPSECW